ncbi:MAG: dihydrofolate reductase family protein, partial [Micrococcales bacterium]
MIELVFFAAISADGYLAGPDGDMAWAEKYLTTGEDYGFVELMSNTNAMLMGSKTFDFNLQAMGDEPQPLPTFVLTNSPMKYDGLKDPNVHLIHGPFESVMAELSRHIDGQMLILGGADVVRQAMDAGLLAKIQLFITPDVLGGGLPLF